jgi:very-short-patch-repair endonuclease
LRTRAVSPQRQALLAARAAAMRAEPSPAEQLLWAALVNRKLGVSFRRQVPLAGYICDFVCASRKLVVEVDGAHHARRAAADARKDRALASLGYRVLRIEASVVLRELAVAVGLVRAACQVGR